MNLTKSREHKYTLSRDQDHEDDHKEDHEEDHEEDREEDREEDHKQDHENGKVSSENSDTESTEDTPTEAIKKHSKTKGTREDATTAKEAKDEVKNTELVRFFLEMLAVIRLSHWATKSYSLHIATNTLYEELDKLVDEFVETLQGKLVSQRITSNRIRLIDEEISLTSIPESQDITDKVVAYIQRLHSLTDSLNSKTDSDLLTIRDDILKLLEHFLYMASMN
jgi:hypothetical protein